MLCYIVASLSIHKDHLTILGWKFTALLSDGTDSEDDNDSVTECS